ncbi:MAG: very short patch repair endonuclease [Bauldia sp.]
MTKSAFPTDAATSARMGRIRQRDTSPELTVRRFLWKRGVRFTTHNRDLPGSPDLANRSRKWAMFVHGCFWHGHEGCPRATRPRRNANAWTAKIDANRERDLRKHDALLTLGFEVATVWECEAAALNAADERVIRIRSRPSRRHRRPEPSRSQRRRPPT